jgi:hypothetical protein
VILNRALVRNVGTCRPDAKGGIQAGGPPRAEYRWAQGRSSNSGEALLLCNGAGPKGLHCSGLGGRPLERHWPICADRSIEARTDRDPPAERTYRKRMVSSGR